MTTKDDTARRIEEYAAEFDAQCGPIMAKHDKQMQRLRDEILAGIQRAAWRLIGRGLIIGLILGLVLGVLAGQCFGATHYAYAWADDPVALEQLQQQEAERAQAIVQFLFVAGVLAMGAMCFGLLCWAMESNRRGRGMIVVAAMVFLTWAILAGSLKCFGAMVRTPNFIVSTPNPAHAQEFAAAAERYRRDLAVSWLGKAMPNWSAPCTIKAEVGERFGAGAATSFVFDNGEVFGWRMIVQGSRAKILTAVLPHEITHMVLASHFRHPLPRWADEGAAISVEPAAEQTKHRKMLIRFLQTGRGIGFERMFAMAEYPRDIMSLYAQGVSSVNYLVQQGGRRQFVRFLEEAFRSNSYSAALQTVYKIPSTPEFQTRWLAWVRKGSPNLGPGVVMLETGDPLSDSEWAKVTARGYTASAPTGPRIHPPLPAGTPMSPVRLRPGALAMRPPDT